MPDSIRKMVADLMPLLLARDKEAISKAPPGQNPPCPACGGKKWKTVAQGFACRAGCGYVRPAGLQ